LDEIQKWIDAVSLVHYLRQDTQITSIVFPHNSEKIINVKSTKAMVVWDEVPETFVQKKTFLRTTSMN
jgi:membrane protease subunit (stomatin/prohibitin family)